MTDRQRLEMERRIQDTRDFKLNVAPWWQALSTVQQKQVELAVGPVESFTNWEKVLYYLGDFRLLKHQTFLGQREVGDFPEDVCRTIMDWCFVYEDYVPMLVYNLKFEPDYEVSYPVPQCPNVTLADIADDKIVGYREKIDGTPVYLATVRRREYQLQCWVGGISCPNMLPGVKFFELRGQEAFSIEPYNVSGTVHFPWADMIFSPRRMELSVSPQWKEGAIAYVVTSAGWIEKRVKRIVTVELMIEGGQARKGTQVYPLKIPVLVDGVYECAKYEGVIYPLKYRPWKGVKQNTFSALALPTVFALGVIPLRTIKETKGPFRVSRESVFVPETVEFAPVMAAFRLGAARGEMRAYSSEIGNTPLDVKVRYLKDSDMILEATDSGLLGRPAMEGDHVNTMEFQSSERTIVTPLGRLWLRPSFPEGTVIFSGANMLVKEEEGWQSAVFEEGAVRKLKKYSDQQVAEAHSWALYLKKNAPCMYFQSLALWRSDMIAPAKPNYVPYVYQGNVPSLADLTVLGPHVQLGGCAQGTQPASWLVHPRYFPPEKLKLMLKVPVKFEALMKSVRGFKMPFTDDDVMVSLLRHEGEYWVRTSAQRWVVKSDVVDKE